MIARTRSLGFLLVIVVAIWSLFRLMSLGMPALIDPTEGRYASIAQRMLTSGNWLMPYIDRGEGAEAFWGKPPLHFWLTAGSFTFFGFNEWAARFPSFLAAFGMLILTFTFARRIFDEHVALGSVMILMSSLLFFFLSGTCILDVTLSFFICGALVSFCTICVSENPKEWRGWGYAFFFFLALGMLTKGPVAVVLTGCPIFLYLLIGKNWAFLLRIPWFTGILLFTALTLPWFLMAENSYPGFLHYFFVQENFLRFISKEYGDKYGNGHSSFFGASALMLLGAFFPWTLLLVLDVYRGGKNYFKRLTLKENQWQLYCVLWGIGPALFFFPARQVLMTYLLPGLPGLAIYLSSRLLLSNSSVRAMPRFTEYVVPVVSVLALVAAVVGSTVFAPSFGVFTTILSVVSAGLLLLLLLRSAILRASLGNIGFGAVGFSLALVLLVISFAPYLSSTLSTRSLIEYVHKVDPSPRLTFMFKLPYSAQFYGSMPVHKIPVSLWQDVTGKKPLQGDVVVRMAKKDIKKLSPEQLSEAQNGHKIGVWSFMDLDADALPPGDSQATRAMLHP